MIAVAKDAFSVDLVERLIAQTPPQRAGPLKLYVHPRDIGFCNRHFPLYEWRPTQILPEDCIGVAGVARPDDAPE